MQEQISFKCPPRMSWVLHIPDTYRTMATDRLKDKVETELKHTLIKNVYGVQFRHTLG